MIIHVIPNPRTPTGLSNPMDPFSVLCYKYIKYLSKSFPMIHYGLPGSTVDCPHVNINETDIVKFNEAVGKAIKERSNSGDVIVCFYGTDNKLACDMNPQCIIVEPSIGYDPSGVFANYRVFTSYAHMHMFYGRNNMLMSPSWFDEVIPNGFDPLDFDYCEDKEDYYLCLGRICAEKGIHLAIQATEHMGKKLVLAGPGSLEALGYSKTPAHVTLVQGPNQSAIDANMRRILLSKAKCLLGLTTYVEPFGNMVIEAGFSGTPVITTDWGGFTETVKHGLNGYRIRDWSELIVAMEDIELGNIYPQNCVYNAYRKYTEEAVHEKHKHYLHKVMRADFYAQ